MLIIIIFVIYYFFIPKDFKIKTIINYFNNLSNYNLRGNMISYIKSNYNKDVSEFLLLLLFGERDYKSELVKNVIGLNILHLFVISGLHLKIIDMILSKILYKYIKFKKVISLFTQLFLAYMLNFSLSILRVCLLNIIKDFFLKKKMKSIMINCLCSIILMTIFINDAISISFVMINVCVITINIIYIFTANKYLRTFIINIFLFLFILPLVLKINQKVNLLSLIFSFYFSFIILITFLFLLLFVWIPFMFSVSELIVKFNIFLINSSSEYKQFIEISINNESIIIFYFIWILIINYIYLKKLSIKSKIIF